MPELIALITMVLSFVHGWCFAGWLARRGVSMPVWYQVLLVAPGGIVAGYLVRYILTGET